MAFKFTKIPSNTFQQLQMNAGIMLKSFDVATGTFNESDMLGATTGGVNFTSSPSFVDFGEDIDNCPKNTKELKQIDQYDVKMSGTFVSAGTATAKMLTGAADVANEKITPRQVLEAEDFANIWWVGDYTNVNNGANAGFIAIKLINALSTGGFQIQTTDKGKGQFAFEFTGHYSIADQDVVPFEIYVKEGTV